MNAFNTLLDKEMDRKQFLLYAGMILMTIIGLSGVINKIRELTSSHSSGFGSGPYGGR